MKYNRKLLVAILLIASIVALGYFMISPAAVDTSSCVCPMMYAPVCGDDGQTYSNSCVAGCAGVEVDYIGECISLSPPKQECEARWWYDDNNQICQYKNFCGTYMYDGLYTFTTKDECDESLRSESTIRGYLSSIWQWILSLSW